MDKASTYEASAKAWTFEAKAKAWTFEAKDKAIKFGPKAPRGQGLGSRITSLGKRSRFSVAVTRSG